MDYPIGGARAIVDALLRGLERNGGRLQLKTRVKELVRENGRVSGVRLQDGSTVRAKRCVISTASIWDTQELLGPGALTGAAECWSEAQKAVEPCPSFMHLHLGFKSDGLDPLQCHYMFMDDWARGVDGEENAALVSIPTAADPSLAPSGYHSMHIYTPATEPWSRWEGVERGTPEYEALKAERTEFLWKVAERVIPDIRERAVLSLEGTPLTHRRFLNTHKGTYGPAIRADAGDMFPPPSTPIPGLVLAGDATFPGIGVPAVAASGLVAAHSALGLETLPKHLELLERVGG